MTQKELASRLLVSDKAVSKWETGNSMPDITLLVPLAEVLNVTVTELLKCKRMKKTDSLDAWAHLQSISADNLYLFALVGILCGCYFWIFAKEKIPAY